LADAVILFAEWPTNNGQNAQALKEVATDVLQAHLLGREGVDCNPNWIRVRDSHESCENRLFTGQLPIQIRSD
jgi:hypothetical protein